MPIFFMWLVNLHVRNWPGSDDLGVAPSRQLVWGTPDALPT
jgi:hypothetical protein